MSETTRSLGIRLDLSRLGAQQPVHQWIATPANTTDAPPFGRMRSVSPQVISARQKPRLSGPELLVRYGGAASTASPVEGSRNMGASFTPPATAHRAVLGLRPLWGLALVITAVGMSAGTPVY